jgi:tRNA pseudouridine55 synthase
MYNNSNEIIYFPLEETILLVYKPKGITSFACLKKLKKQIGCKKIGHAGTLDPNASGLLIVGIESGTKKLNTYLKLDKHYEATIQLGIKTDTGDCIGTTIDTKPIVPFTKDDLLRACKKIIGTHTVAAPRYSALKYKGKPLYVYARRGIIVPEKIREMTVYNAKILSYSDTTITIAFHVSSGTYIRTLGELFANELGTVGTLLELTRTSIGNYSLPQINKIKE